MARPTNITLCSFCGKSHAEVKKLIAGPGVYICDNCVVLCKQVLDKELAPQARKHKPRITIAKPAEIKRLLDLQCIGQDHAKKTLAVAVHNHYKRILQEPPANSTGRAVELAYIDDPDKKRQRNFAIPPGLLIDDLNVVLKNPEVSVAVELVGGLEPARSITPRSRAWRKDPGLRPKPTTSSTAPASLRARAKEPPIRPTPKMTTF